MVSENLNDNSDCANISSMQNLEETFVDLNDLHNLLGMPTFSGDGGGLLFSCRKLPKLRNSRSGLVIKHRFHANCAGRLFNLWTLRVGAYSRLGIGRFYTRDALPVWTKLGKHL